MPPSANTHSGIPSFSFFTLFLIESSDLSAEIVSVSVNRKIIRIREEFASPSKARYLIFLGKAAPIKTGSP